MSSALFLLRRTPEYSIAQPEIACRNYRTVAKVFLLRPDKKFSGIKISLFGVLSFTASALFFAVISLAKTIRTDVYHIGRASIMIFYVCIINRFLRSVNRFRRVFTNLSTDFSEIYGNFTDFFK